MSQQMMVFVSYAHEDETFCRAVVQGLRGAGADVWYDEHNLGSGQLMEVIQRELGRRPIVVLILSKAAFASTWVRREITWAYHLLDRDPTRLILPVTASPIERDDFDPEQGWLFLEDFKRIEAAGMQPHPISESVKRLLRSLALTPAGEAPAPTLAPQPTEVVEDLLARGKALQAQGQHGEALPLFERATQIAPHSFDAWFNRGFTLTQLKRPALERLAAYEQATTLDPSNALAWYNKGNTLLDLNRFDEALAACDRATTLDPMDALAWNNLGVVLSNLDRYDEALAAYEQATALDPSNEIAWNNLGNTLLDLARYDEALTAYERATILNPSSATAWYNKGVVLSNLDRYDEALAAYEQATALDPSNAVAWRNAGNTLNGLSRYTEALTAYERSLALDPSSIRGWKGKAAALRGLGLSAEAAEAEGRMQELGG